MAIKRLARSFMLVPRKGATPYSVTTKSTSLRERETAAPGFSMGTILETRTRSPSAFFMLAVE
jgi:hypothetical protein